MGSFVYKRVSIPLNTEEYTPLRPKEDHSKSIVSVTELRLLLNFI